VQLGTHEDQPVKARDQDSGMERLLDDLIGTRVELVHDLPGQKGAGSRYDEHRIRLPLAQIAQELRVARTLAARIRSKNS